MLCSLFTCPKKNFIKKNESLAIIVRCGRCTTPRFRRRIAHRRSVIGLVHQRSFSREALFHPHLIFKIPPELTLPYLTTAVSRSAETPRMQGMSNDTSVYKSYNNNIA